MVTGLKREVLEQFIKEIVPNFNVTMPPGKSYCFVNFLSADSSKIFYEKVHGNVQVPNEDTVFYLLYIKSSKHFLLPITIISVILIIINYFSVPCIEETFGNDLPPGLRLLTDFVTPEEEAALLESINWDEEEGKDLKFNSL